MRNLEKPSFKPLGAANILENLGVALEWNSCPDIEVGLFIDGNAYVKCKAVRSISVYSTVIFAEKGETAFELLRNAFCTQAMRSTWPDLIGISAVKGETEDKQIQLKIYSLTSSLSRNNQAQKCVTESLGITHKDLKLEVKNLILVDSSKRGLMGRNWVIFGENLITNERTEPIFQTPLVSKLGKLARTMIFSAFKFTRPFRTVISWNDRDWTAAYNKLELVCPMDDAFEMITMILVASSNSDRVAGTYPSEGLERAIGFTFEKKADGDALVSIHFAENDRDGQERVSSFLKRLLYANNVNELSEMALEGKPAPIAPRRWKFATRSSERILENETADSSILEFISNGAQHVLELKRVPGCFLGITPLGILPSNKAGNNLVLVINLPKSTNMSLFMLRLWADILRTKRFCYHNQIDKYVFQSLAVDGPYTFLVWLRDSGYSLDFQEEMRRFFLVFLMYVGIEGVTPFTAVMEGIDRETLTPVCSGPIDLSTIRTDIFKSSEWSVVETKTNDMPKARARVKSNAKTTKPAPHKKSRASNIKELLNQPVQESQNEEISLENVIEEESSSPDTPPVEIQITEPPVAIEIITRLAAVEDETEDKVKTEIAIVAAGETETPAIAEDDTLVHTQTESPSVATSSPINAEEKEEIPKVVTLSNSATIVRPTSFPEYPEKGLNTSRKGRKGRHQESRIDSASSSDSMTRRSSSEGKALKRSHEPIILGCAPISLELKLESLKEKPSPVKPWHRDYVKTGPIAEKPSVPTLQVNPVSIEPNPVSLEKENTKQPIPGLLFLSPVDVRLGKLSAVRCMSREVYHEQEVPSGQFSLVNDSSSDWTSHEGSFEIHEDSTPRSEESYEIHEDLTPRSDHEDLTPRSEEPDVDLYDDRGPSETSFTQKTESAMHTEFTELEKKQEGKPDGYYAYRFDFLGNDASVYLEEVGEGLPLQYSWKMFFIDHEYTVKPLSSKESPINTVAMFWRYMNNLPEVPREYSFCFWKPEGEPKWEAPENKKGGRLRIQIPYHPIIKPLAQWSLLLTWLVANQEDELIELLNGVVIKHSRKLHNIDIWYSQPLPQPMMTLLVKCMGQLSDEYELNWPRFWKNLPFTENK